MATSLKNQIALVTGTASGISHAYTKYLLQNRVKVTVCDINFENCQTVVRNFSDEYDLSNVLALCCDVTDQEQFDNAFKSCISYFKRLDIVINNAGVFNESMKNWETAVKINYGGVVRGTRLAIEYMGIPFGGKGGTIVQTASIAAIIPYSHVGAMYGSTKRAIVEYTRAIGDERSFKHLNIRAIVLCPSFVDTHFIYDDNQYLIKDFAKITNEIIDQFPI